MSTACAVDMWHSIRHRLAAVATGSIGNLSENPKAFLFLMDYVNQQRIKLWGQAEVVEGDSELNDRLSDANYSAKVERSILFRIEAWDINCPQHIHRRFPATAVEQVIESLRNEVEQLKNEIATLRHGPIAQ